MSNLVTILTNGPVVTLTLNRPMQHNGLTPELLTELEAHIIAARQHHGLRAIVLQASGAYFSCGTDLIALARQTDRLAYADHGLRLLHQVMLTLIDLPVPLIVAVQGPVNGSALGLVVVADIVLVTPNAHFTAYATTLGLSPEGGWTTLLPRLIGQRRAGEVLLLERPITAEEAVAWGLANRLVAPGHLFDEAQALAYQIATQMPGSIACTRRLLWAEREQIAAALNREREVYCERIQSIEADLGLKAFLDRQRTTMSAEEII
ncbi:enoyl-CoA hydratase/isomerase family protein [Chloroflexus aurantiacus]